MPLGDGTRESVEAAVARLRDRYGDFPVAAETVENAPERFEEGVEVAADGRLAGAGAWVEASDGRVLFIRHPAAPDIWGLPGGGVEPDETLAEAAAREVEEETGVSVRVTDAWKARHRTIVRRDDPDRRLHVVDAWFDAVPTADIADRDAETSVAAATSEADEEVLEARWFATPPDAVHDPFEDRVAAWRDE